MPLATPIAPGLWCDGRSVGPQGYGELPVSESGSCQGPWLRSVSALGIEAIAGLGAIGSGRCPAGTGVDLRLYPMGQTTPCSLAWSAMVSPQALADLHANGAEDTLRAAATGLEDQEENDRRGARQSQHRPPDWVLSDRLPLAVGPVPGRH